MEKEWTCINTVIASTAILVSEKGFEQVKLGDILRVSKISRTKFYYYFGSKQEVFELMIRIEVDKMYDELKLLNSAHSLSRQEVTECKNQYIEKNPVLNVFFDSNTALSEDLLALRAELRLSESKFFRDAMKVKSFLTSNDGIIHRPEAD